jgi:hypothetical protein
VDDDDLEQAERQSPILTVFRHGGPALCRRPNPARQTADSGNENNTIAARAVGWFATLMVDRYDVRELE